MIKVKGFVCHKINGKLYKTLVSCYMVDDFTFVYPYDSRGWCVVDYRTGATILRSNTRQMAIEEYHKKQKEYEDYRASKLYDALITFADSAEIKTSYELRDIIKEEKR